MVTENSEIPLDLFQTNYYFVLINITLFNSFCEKIFMASFTKSPAADVSNSSSSHLSSGYAFYQSMGCPKRVIAPMVEQCELAYRMMTRKYGADLVYTQMFSANQFSESEEFRRQHLVTCPEDRPLIVQLAGHDPEKMLASALIIQSGKYGVVDAVDINIGCPQNIAKRGRYGAFLMEELELLEEMVSLMTRNLTTLAVTCKSRIYKLENGQVDMSRTIRLYETLIRAGAKMITIHCRTRDEKGFLVSAPDWHAIAQLVEYFDHRVPIIANGGIENLDDYYECLRVTGADGVMSAEGVLEDPSLFMERSLRAKEDRCIVRGRRFSDAIGGTLGTPSPDELLTAGTDITAEYTPGDFPMRQLYLARVYLNFCKRYNYQHACLMRTHVIKMLYRYTSNFMQLTEFIIKAITPDQFLCVCDLIEEVVVQSCVQQLMGGEVEVLAPVQHTNTGETATYKRKKCIVLDFERMVQEARAIGASQRVELQQKLEASGEWDIKTVQEKLAAIYWTNFHVSWYNRHRDPDSKSKSAPQNRPTASEVTSKHFKGRRDNTFWNAEVEAVLIPEGECQGVDCDILEGEDGEGDGQGDADSDETVVDNSLFAIFGMSDSYC